jgi:hypothetical protein
MAALPVAQKVAPAEELVAARPVAQKVAMAEELVAALAEELVAALAEEPVAAPVEEPPEAAHPKVEEHHPKAAALRAAAANTFLKMPSS